MGLVISAGVYRSDIGYIWVSREAVSSDGENLSTPRPFVVVHSGKTTM